MVSPNRNPQNAVNGPPAPAAGTPPSSAASAPMDAEFIARNQIVERYLAGKLPLKGVSDFERFVRDNPALIEDLGLADRVHASLRLLEVGGKPEPWAEKPRKFWEKLPFIGSLAGAAAVLLVASLVLVGRNSEQAAEIADLKRQVAEQPLLPTQSTRTVLIKPAGFAPAAAQLTLTAGVMADLKIELTQTRYNLFRVSIDRIDQGRVAVLENVLKDSNKHLRLKLNPSALGPGDYMLKIEGLNMRREGQAVAWVRLRIDR